MGTNNSRPRIATPLVEETNRRLQAYALVAAAAGVGLLALAQTSNAEVVRRKAVISQTFPIDLNRDGLIDFTLYNSFIETFSGPSSFLVSRRLNIGGGSGAGVVAKNKRASALIYGSVIGSSRLFHDVNAQKVAMATDVWFGCGSSCSGVNAFRDWQHVHGRYLGLKFQINGETHYGWVRLNTDNQTRPPEVRAKVTGFAYETIPNQPIIAGQMGTAAQGKNLGELSRGSEGR